MARARTRRSPSPRNSFRQKPLEERQKIYEDTRARIFAGDFTRTVPSGCRQARSLNRVMETRNVFVSDTIDDNALG